MARNRTARGILGVARPRNAGHHASAAQDEVVRFQAVRWFCRRPRQLEVCHPDGKGAADLADNLILDRKDILRFGVVLLLTRRERCVPCP